MTARGIGNVAFRRASAHELPFAEDSFDAVFAHSMLETLANPSSALAEMRRVLRPGGLVGVASVDYGGIVLAGPEAALLRRFYAIREQLWELGGDSPYRGRELRGLLNAAGFTAVSATTRAIPYGTDDAVQAFGRDRAEQARGGGFVGAALEHELATADELAAMAEAWLGWSEAPDAYFAFVWCRAIGVKPERATSR